MVSEFEFESLACMHARMYFQGVRATRMAPNVFAERLEWKVGNKTFRETFGGLFYWLLR
jgi:hypothetical protein